MDNFQKKLRLLIVTGSAVGFIGGWGLLARAGKPATGGDTTADVMVDAPVNMPAPVVVPTLPPLDFKSIEGGTTPNTNQQFTPNIQSAPAPQMQSVPSFRPRIRTRSS